MSRRRTPRRSGTAGPSAPALRPALLGWYRANRRDLPWRRTRDPYAVWISESMLQQTRVETAIPYYERFLARFPDVRALAEADTEEVLAAWAGLGYYARARNLQAAARTVIEEFGGRIPDDARSLRSLPGVGRYTAGAVASIAFDRPEPVVDGNAARVLSRVYGIGGDVRRTAALEQLWERAAGLARGRAPGDVNQALMELGATLCTPRAPRCPACPLSRHCVARAEDIAESLPVKGPAREPRPLRATAALVPRSGRMLTVRRPDRGLLAGMWSLPGDELAANEPPGRGVVRALRERAGLRVDGIAEVGVVEHVFTHRRLRLHLFRCESAEGRVRLDGFDAHRWLAPSRLAGIFHHRLGRKTLELAESRGALR